MNEKKKVHAFIDGFNLYHAVKDLNKPHFKWIDLWKLCNCFVPPRTHELKNVFYFSAIATWLKDAAKRHKLYISALETKNVTPVLGKFKTRTNNCKRCGHSWDYHEEKQTDANLIASLTAQAVQDRFDSALLITQDTDFAMVVGALNHSLKKPITIVLPPRSMKVQSLLNAANGKAKITENHLERCQLEEIVKDDNGRIVAERPNEWRKL